MKERLVTAHPINPPTGAYQAEGGALRGLHWIWDQQQVHGAERDGSAGLPGQGADQLLHEAVLRPHPPLRHRTDRQHGPGGDPPQQASQVPVLLLPMLSSKAGGRCHTSMRIVKPLNQCMHIQGPQPSIWAFGDGRAGLDHHFPWVHFERCSWKSHHEDQGSLLHVELLRLRRRVQSKRIHSFKIEFFIWDTNIGRKMIKKTLLSSTQIGRDSWWEWNRHDHQAVVRIGKRGVYWRWQLWSQLPSGPWRQGEGKKNPQKKL